MLFGINHYASTTVLTFCDRIWRAGCVLTLPAHAGGCITVKKKVEKRKDEIRKIAAMATTKIPAKKSKWLNQVVIGEARFATAFNHFALLFAVAIHDQTRGHEMDHLPLEARSRRDT